MSASLPILISRASGHFVTAHSMLRLACTCTYIIIYNHIHVFIITCCIWASLPTFINRASGHLVTAHSMNFFSAKSRSASARTSMSRRCCGVRWNPMRSMSEETTTIPMSMSRNKLRFKQWACHEWNSIMSQESLTTVIHENANTTIPVSSSPNGIQYLR